MIVARYEQRTIFETAVALMPDHKELFWEDWMLEADKLLEDRELVEIVQKALEKRRPRSSTFGRVGTPADVILRMMILKHRRDWSFEDLVREVRANVVYRDFTRIGGQKVPERSTLIKIANFLGPEVIRAIHGRVRDLGINNKVSAGKKMRVDTTVVETNIHYPTDSSLLGDGVRVLTRTMKRIQRHVGQVGTKLRDRTRSVKYKLIEIARTSKAKAQENQDKLKRAYEKLMTTTGRVICQAKAFTKEVRQGIKRAATPIAQLVVDSLATYLDEISGLTKRVIAQTKARIVRGDTHYKEKVFSIFESFTEAIRKGKAAKPTEFGKMVKIQEAEGQMIVEYEVFEKRPADADLLIPSIEKHKEIYGVAPHLVAADAGFFSAKNEQDAKVAGVAKVAVPCKGTPSQTRRKHQKQRWFRHAQRWRVGCEGRISVIKRRHGLFRSRYKGEDGMARWVGLGVIANNLTVIGAALAKRRKNKAPATQIEN
jgi:IS5 family transposase